MKTLMRIVSTLLAIVVFTGFVHSQEYRKMQLSKQLRFDNETKPAEAKVNVTSDYNYLSIHIASILTEGELKVEIYDPDGKSKGYFNIIAEGDISSGSKTIVESEVNGEMERHYREPIIGDWIVKFTPKNAKGLARLRSNLIFNPRADMLEAEQIEGDTDANIE